MRVIPVIDLRAGRVVRAVAGRRDQYKPLSGPLCTSSDPLDVVAALRRVRPFALFYLADLDAIQDGGDNRAVVTELLAAFPSVAYWLDAGFGEPRRALSWPLSGRLRPVLGSESQCDAASFRALCRRLADRRPLLSLDFRDGEFLGPGELLSQPESWPEEVILMRLDRVGVGQGPDATLPAAAGQARRRWYAAGGVRDEADLRALEAQGYAGALVASALHAGTLFGGGNAGPP